MDDLAYRPDGSRFTRVKSYFLDLFDRFVDAGELDLHIMRRESDLFFGVLLFILGLLNFHSGRYCDGNTADYLSCTRPVTYYYYTWLEVMLIVVGIFFMLLWFLKRRDDR
jgi:hypothetical protein